jgi:nucleotide-binding universal stress UspA family protein
MKIGPSKKLGRFVREVGARTEPRDFSVASMAGVRFAVSFAEKLGAAVVLVHVIEPGSRLSGIDKVVLARKGAAVVELAERQVAKLAEKLSRTNLLVTFIVGSGKPFNAIATLARQGRADLVVIATRGHTGVKRILLGSTTERVVRHAPCPVLTVSAQGKPRWKNRVSRLQLRKVVVAIDFSETSAQALPYAASMAERFGAEVILLHVIQPPAPTSPYSPSDLEIAVYAMKRRATAQLSQLSEEVFDGNVVTRIVVRLGTPYDEITKAAKRLGTDMILLTTHGYTGLKHALLGSTAERVLRYAPCPVLVVRRSTGWAKQPLLKRELRIRSRHWK